MMKGRSFLCPILFAMAILTEPFCRDSGTWAQDNEAAILYDGSGSMEGFFSTRSIQEINEQLHDLLDSFHIGATSDVFVSTNRTQLYPLSDFLGRPTWGAHTRIDDALSQASGRQVIVLVTDNVQDVGGDNYSSTRSFYRMLEKDSIRTVLLFPIQLSFSGRLYFSKVRHPDTQQLLNNLIQKNTSTNTFEQDNYKSDRYHTVWMTGRKALAVYFIFSRSFPEGQMANFMNSAQKILKVEPLMVKPIDQEKFFLKGVNDKEQVKASFSELEKSCSTTGPERYIPTPPNLHLLPPSSGIYRPILDEKAKPYQVSPFKKKGSTPYIDRPIRFRLYFTVVNQARFIVLGRHENSCSKEVKIHLQRIEYRLPSTYQECFRSNTDARVAIIPPFIPYAIVPTPEEELEGDRLPVFSSEIQLPAFSVILSLRSILKLAFTPSIPFEMRGALELTVPAGHFSLETGYERRYFTRSELDQGRIYTPEDVVHYIHVSPTALQFALVCQGCRLLPPLWIKILVYGVILLLLLLIVYIVLNASHHYYLKFGDTGKAIDVYLPIPFTKKEYNRNDKTVFTIKKGIWSYQIFPADGHHLDSDGGTITSLKLNSETDLKITGSEMNSIVESIPFEKFSTLKQEDLSKRKKQKEKLPKQKTEEEDKGTPKGKSRADILFGPDKER